ncbi:MAG TPA: ATP phosphoribosyltransferase regulatory subunit, partial [Candidatus Saccharimonadales bacterium]|nr:ATP phosphoribosyltransferase regulatory subunit [Candidatus Saccharimonadales bacterium]
PTEARELHAIERTLLGAFADHGYVPLEPPAVEFASGAITMDERRMLRFLDRDGRLLALRPDVTTAIARVVAQRYRDADAPLRLSYFTAVFREEASMRGSEREYDQAGIELVGASGALADCEVVALLADALARCGLLSVEIDVGHAGYLNGFTGELPADARDRFAAAAREGDLVRALGLARAAGISAKRAAALERGLRHRGPDIVAARADAPKGSLKALDELEALIPLFEAAGIGAAVRFDLGFIPALPYYSGVVFQVTAPGLGFPVAAGGRYDGLLGHFGADRPATGFAINVPHLHQAVLDAGWSPDGDAALLLLEPANDPVVTVRVATTLRRAGIAVCVGPVAERAGREVRAGRIIDEGHVAYEGTSRTLEALVTLLGGSLE